MIHVKKSRLWATLGLLVLALVLAVGPAGAASVTPVKHLGNVDCTDLGYAFEFKIDPPDAGTYDVGSLGSITIVRPNDQTVNWTSTFGIDAVLVKGGPNTNEYKYDPPEESFGDDGLQAPDHPTPGQVPNISHLNFCYDIELQVSKTVETTFTRTFEWDIKKSVTPAEWDLFSGDSGTSEYTIDITKTGFIDNDWAVNGTITIFNPHPTETAIIESVTDGISGFVGTVDVDCDVTFPHELDPGETLECTYGAGPIDSPDDNPFGDLNTATVVTSGPVGGGEAQDDVIFGAPTTVVNDTINVDDTFAGHLGTFSDSGSVSYTRTFECDGDEGDHNNTATIVETGDSDDALVEINCHELEVTKDADTSFTRTWEWTIEKSADQTDLLLTEGQLFPVNYEVTVDAVAVDSEFAVSGDIAVHNPAPIDATINAVNDIVSPALAATADCGVTFPYTLAAGATLDCTYEADLPDDEPRTNTATATLQNFHYDPPADPAPIGTTDFDGTADVDFADATINEVDECVDVSDTNVGDLGEVCAGDAPQTFNYSLDFGAHPDADVILECGDNTHTNTASFVTNDTFATREDDETVNAHVECDEGCTLTPGYWKTHSDKGPAPFDETWDLLPDGSDTIFFESGQTYYEVLWTAPSGGNAYYILAHAYIAAKLNILNGASSTPEVDAAIAFAEAFFAGHEPSDTLSKTVRKNAISNAKVLDDYNNGLIGPGHCSE